MSSFVDWWRFYGYIFSLFFQLSLARSKCARCYSKYLHSIDAGNSIKFSIKRQTKGHRSSSRLFVIIVDCMPGFLFVCVWIEFIISFNSFVKQPQIVHMNITSRWKIHCQGQNCMKKNEIQKITTLKKNVYVQWKEKKFVWWKSEKLFHFIFFYLLHRWTIWDIMHFIDVSMQNEEKTLQ